MMKNARWTLTEEEGDQILTLCNEYWREFSALVNKFVNRAPETDLRDLVEMKLQEHSSVYGRDEHA
jgi:hypothetical protein